MLLEVPESALQISRRSDGVIVIEGELTQDHAAEFQVALAALQAASDAAMIFDLFGFEVADGLAVATTINALRELLQRTGKVTLLGAPQMLAHNLYRVGMLEANSAIALIDMREDEPYG
ncbi:MAG: STAS domain-containing protein [Acidobacteria bacterium]|nr:STAS domain-containing protein [Acidobacteriota bacterium]